jgi:hypothetical protein
MMMMMMSNAVLRDLHKSPDVVKAVKKEKLLRFSSDEKLREYIQN